METETKEMIIEAGDVHTTTLKCENEGCDGVLVWNDQIPEDQMVCNKCGQDYMMAPLPYDKNEILMDLRAMKEQIDTLREDLVHIINWTARGHLDDGRVVRIEK